MLVTTEEARQHCRADSADDLTVYIGAAEESIAEFLNRGIFETVNALNAARAEAITADAAARAAYLASIDLAMAIEDCYERERALEVADTAWQSAKSSYMAAQSGMVVNRAIKAAILLRTGDLYRNREERIDAKIQLSSAIESLLMPYRVGWGV